MSAVSAPAGLVERVLGRGVLLIRGAGDGSSASPARVSAERATTCGCEAASSWVRTGAKQASTPLNRSHHCSAVPVSTMAWMRSLRVGHAVSSN